MIAQVNTPLWVVILGIVAGSGGILGAIALAIKARPEASKILIQAAGEVVVIQKGTIEDLQKRIDELEEEIASLRGRVKQEEANNLELRQENAELRQRIDTLESNGTTPG